MLCDVISIKAIQNKGVLFLKVLNNLAASFHSWVCIGLKLSIIAICFKWCLTKYWYRQICLIRQMFKCTCQIGHRPILCTTNERNRSINHSEVGEYVAEHPVAIYTCAKRLGPCSAAHIQLTPTSEPCAVFSFTSKNAASETADLCVHHHTEQIEHAFKCRPS
jgi:hypothetical protein